MTCLADGMDGDGGVRIGRITELINDMSKRALLRLQLAIVAVVMTPTIKATYNMEGEAAAMSLVSYDTIMSVDTWFEH